MKYIYNTTNIKISENTIVILGNFDGIHIGHQELFSVAIQKAKDNNLKTLLLSFHPHPTWVLGDNPKSLLMSRQEKQNRIKNLGIDIYVEYPFSPEFAKVSANKFIKQIILNKLNGKAVVVGENYFFGKNQEGNVSYMLEMGHKHNFKVFVVNEIKKQNKTISSSHIRHLIESGKINQANILLGKPYIISGIVIKGKQLGRTLGFPTVNIIPHITKILPPNGVYIVKITILNKQYFGLANIGYNPTVNGKNKKIETYVFNFSKNVYKEKVDIEIIKFLRPEKKFNSISQLKDQMTSDEIIALKYINNL